MSKGSGRWPAALGAAALGVQLVVLIVVITRPRPRQVAIHVVTEGLLLVAIGAGLFLLVVTVLAVCRAVLVRPERRR